MITNTIDPLNTFAIESGEIQQQWAQQSQEQQEQLSAAKRAYYAAQREVEKQQKALEEKRQEALTRLNASREAHGAAIEAYNTVVYNTLRKFHHEPAIVNELHRKLIIPSDATVLGISKAHGEENPHYVFQTSKGKMTLPTSLFRNDPIAVAQHVRKQVREAQNAALKRSVATAKKEQQTAERALQQAQEAYNRAQRNADNIQRRLDKNQEWLQNHSN
jgi:molecular chaperone GrpE (heat shock protein)